MAHIILLGRVDKTNNWLPHTICHTQLHTHLAPWCGIISNRIKWTLAACTTQIHVMVNNICSPTERVKHSFSFLFGIYVVKRSPYNLVDAAEEDGKDDDFEDMNFTHAPDDDAGSVDKLIQLTTEFHCQQEGAILHSYRRHGKHPCTVHSFIDIVIVMGSRHVSLLSIIFLSFS